MKLNRKAIAASAVGLGLAAALTACGPSEDSSSQDSKDKAAVEQQTNQRGGAYVPKNHVEFNNYNKAQELYDSPNTIIWCSASFPNDNAPLFTVPIRGKLTSSSVSLFPSEVAGAGGQSGWTYTPEQKSVDGMYHGNPPAYRYGFTPGGEYVDFFGLETFCTTQPTKFQREKTEISLSVDPGLADAQKRAQEALAKGDVAGAQKILEGATPR
ncbi:hypothetical protein SEA_MOLLYMUR_76 [Gordonia phage Mollymur]|uniref:Lipoprotein n=1 Tax=Gordonia phage Mollymur TaxID=2590895 RepID=A0A4Y6EDN6_9CAUD|nr:hypothetical protein PQB84_gp050 [Gordonia phage Mollymur]QDF15436.1 hypothetical protein SEA_MOLLYMUR_76 [Gordonia phage Mollymur]